MKNDIQLLIEKLEVQRSAILNPDGETWDSLGFDEPPKQWATVTEYFLSQDYELDEGEQARLEILDEVLYDLRKLNQAMSGEAHIPSDLCKPPLLVAKVAQCLKDQGVPIHSVRTDDKGSPVFVMNQDREYHLYIKPNHRDGGIDLRWEQASGN